MVAEDDGRDRNGRDVTAAVEARLTLAQARTGLLLEPDEAAAVRRQIARSLAQAAALRRVPLENGDEPEIVFVPFRSDVGDGADDRQGNR